MNNGTQLYASSFPLSLLFECRPRKLFHCDITAFAEPSSAPFAKRWQQSGWLQCQCVYEIEVHN